MPELVDDNGRRVVSFASRIRNLGRVAELTDAVIDIATSGAWRDYHVATGHEAWRDAELDYFLIACGMHREDVSRVLAYNAQAKALADMMDRTAADDRRRPLATAATAWHSPTGESLLDRAKRLGWAKDNGTLTASPIPERARAKARHGTTFEGHASLERLKHIPAPRRRELDKLAESVLEQLADAQERRYFIERIARNGAGRPPVGDPRTWQADAERLDWNATALAEHWKVTPSTARRRLKRLREQGERS
jgi:hypothetical protein